MPKFGRLTVVRANEIKVYYEEVFTQLLRLVKLPYEGVSVKRLKGEIFMTMMMSRKALGEYGLVNLGNINWNLSPAVLIEHALARKEGILAANGALAATTGVH